VQAIFAEYSPMTTSVEEFFDEPLEQSRVKARIVSDYVITFTRILSDFQRRKGNPPTVDYVDLFSGPGSYGDGTASTPLLVIRAASRDNKLAPRFGLISMTAIQRKLIAFARSLPSWED
jgi:hypothetical protein